MADNSSKASVLLSWIRLLRPKQWLKNTIVFIPLVFAKDLLNPALLVKSVIAFICFCALSSGIYIINDVIDRDKDRKHPTKRSRPIAAGKIAVKSAVIASVVLLFVAILGSLWFQITFGIIAIAYVVLELSYSLKLRNIAFLDAFCVAGGFILRLAGGTVAIGAPYSIWAFMCIGFMALFISFAKRRTELLQLGEESANHREALSQYNVPFLEQIMLLFLTSTVGVYCIFVLSPETVAKFGSYFALTIPFALYGLIRYFYSIYCKNSSEDPVVNILGDRSLLVSCVLWGISAVLIIYVF